MDDAVKKAFMDIMNEQFVREFGFDMKTMLLFADAISRAKTNREKQLEAELNKAVSAWRGACGSCSKCKHYHGWPDGCDLPEEQVCNDDNDLYDFEGF